MTALADVVFLVGCDNGAYPAADVTVERIGDLGTYELRNPLGARNTTRPQTGHG